MEELERLVARLSAVASAQRLRIVAELGAGPLHVSELARRVGLSRPVLYMHLTRLEEAGVVSSRHELSADGKALKVFSAEDFRIVVDLPTLLRAVAGDDPEVVPVQDAPSDRAPSDTAPSDTGPSDTAPSDTARSDIALFDTALSDIARTDQQTQP
ncbi:ArsR/SmtB family transcription factor [Actinotalea ferrariae]|uniref:ArsR/SmtB family transcription factor n=1 Tax=Actinotalea ferrariae TaxID=1386098 RepID=UPI0027DFFCAE|nr:winged helix-turn-helix domain-containing protein [Actinotalea ferrariae]